MQTNAAVEQNGVMTDDPRCLCSSCMSFLFGTVSITDTIDNMNLRGAGKQCAATALRCTATEDASLSTTCVLVTVATAGRNRYLSYCKQIAVR